LELSSPKDWSIAKEWREHVEFVIDIELEEFIWKYENIIFETKRLYKELNPDIAIKYLDCRVKFHKQSLQYVIEFLE
jgi:predicted metalloenzyme YecM